MNWSYILRRRSILQGISAALQHLFYYTFDLYEVVAAYLEISFLHWAILQFQLYFAYHSSCVWDSDMVLSGKWSQRRVEIFFCWCNTDDQDRGVIHWLFLRMVSDSYMETPDMWLPVCSLFKQDVFLLICSRTFPCSFLDYSD